MLHMRYTIAILGLLAFSCVAAAGDATATVVLEQALVEQEIESNPQIRADRTTLAFSTETTTATALKASALLAERIERMRSFLRREINMRLFGKPIPRSR